MTTITTKITQLIDEISYISVLKTTQLIDKISHIKVYQRC